MLTQLLNYAMQKRKKNLNYMKFGSFVGRFPSDDAESMAVKGLRLIRFDNLWDGSRYYRKGDHPPRDRVAEGMAR